MKEAKGRKKGDEQEGPQGSKEEMSLNVLCNPAQPVIRELCLCMATPWVQRFLYFVIPSSLAPNSPAFVLILKSL